MCREFCYFLCVFNEYSTMRREGRFIIIIINAHQIYLFLIKNKSEQEEMFFVRFSFSTIQFSIMLFFIYHTNLD